LSRKLIKDVITALASYKNPQREEFSKTNYPTRLKVLGVTVPDMKIVLKELKDETKALSARDKINLALELIDTDIFECHHMAYEYIGRDKKVLAELTEKDVDALDQNLDNWVLVDTFSAYFLGYAWRENIISTEKVKSYLKSDDFWKRRCAIVATVALNQKARGGEGDVDRTLEICELAIDDHHDMINKAMSWALRELSKRDKQAVIDFVKKNRDRLNKRVLREVGNKLTTGRKNT
jgi:3-methyladenine DNA glycosylase AlkD